MANTSGAGANLRADPGAQGRRTKLLADGSLVDLVDPGREVEGVLWRLVRDETGEVGWIAAEFLSPVTAVQIRVSPIPGAIGGSTAVPGVATPSTRAVPLDRQHCPESHPIKAVAAGGFLYYATSHAIYDRVQPDVCFSTERAAESTGFRAA